jgi:hypothetical protein
MALFQSVGRDSVVGIAKRYGLNGPRIECRWGRAFPHPSRPTLGPTQPAVQLVSGLFPRVKAAGGGGVEHPPHLALRLKKEYSYTSIAPLGLHGLF